MKCVIFFLVAFVLATVMADGVEFQPHEMPCVWSVEIEQKSLTYYYKYKLYFNDWYFRLTQMNFNGVIVYDKIFRPDLSFVGDLEEEDEEPGNYPSPGIPDDIHVTPVVCVGCERLRSRMSKIFERSMKFKRSGRSDGSDTKLFRKFVYDGYKCYDRRVDFDDYTEHMMGYIAEDVMSGEESNLRSGKRGFEDLPPRFLIAFFLYYASEPTTFGNKDEGYIHKGDKKKYTVYYDDDDKDEFALYVDKDNYIVGAVMNNLYPNLRVEMTAKYELKADLKDFAFDEDYIFNCSHNEIMTPPKGSKERCAASAVTSVVALVVASIVSAVLALF